MGIELDKIEPLKALGIEFVRSDDEGAEFVIPLVGNRNDKGTLFAGSQYSALVLCGWYLASEYTDKHHAGFKVAIKNSDVSFPLPATSDLRVIAQFVQAPDERPNGNIRMLVNVRAIDSDGQTVSSISGDYRAFPS